MGEIDRGSFTRERLDLFWRFINERQSVWQRRFLNRLPPPWTSDKILKENRFTNIYRELDPGTVYAINEILERDAPKADKVFNIMIYRLIGRSDTHRKMGFQTLKDFFPEKVESVLRAIKESGEPPFTAAYMVSGYAMMGSHDKITNVVRIFSLWHEKFLDFYKDLSESSSSKQAYELIKRNKGLGNFLAYQILVDLSYPLKVYSGKGVLPFNNDQWAEAGPGAKKGVAMLLKPGAKVKNLEVMEWLRDHQMDEFVRLDINFPFLLDVNGKNVRISLANMQNCLCEFHKYVKISNGNGRSRRKFTPIIEKRLESG